ncbi:MAG TPA: hypothetical protein VKT18_02840, partial [Acidimicrobiales bacterium]|nr:hypothetical protein [Acidimicrobiales bacterium]
VTAPLGAAARHAARSSLTGALQVAGQLPRGQGAAVATGAKVAFVQGIHVASLAGAALALVAAAVVLRFLPAPATREAAQEVGALAELEAVPALAD